jgi:tRNA (guanine37-N1)-methyltransferase
MRFDIMTLFPEMINSVLNESILGRAQDNGFININTFNIRDFSENKHKKVDDYPYGGGSGMVMTAKPVFNTYNHIISKMDYTPKVIYMTPQGRCLSQKLANDFAKEEHLILLCGHYEGIDERVIEEIVDEEISIGDYVLTGGELAAMVFVDCVSRLVPGVLSNKDSNNEESLYDGLLEYPQYTRPEKILDKNVPKVLLSGHHLNIEKWRKEKSIEVTKRKRPDLYKEYISKNNNIK